MVEEISKEDIKRFSQCGKCNPTKCMPSRENHWNWKGGRYITSGGYVMVQAKSHPRADRGGYVFEHIVVMEKKIGRYLSADEIVHHISGDRQDNRPQNLNLMKRGQHSTHHNIGNKWSVIDMSNRKCCDCGRTHARDRRWYKKLELWQCSNCRDRKHKH